MNTFNRILVVTLLIVIMLVCSVLLILPALQSPLLSLIAERLDHIGTLINRLEWYKRIPVAFLLVTVMDIFLLLLLILELRRPRPQFIRVEKATGGEVQVSIASIADRLRYEIDALPNILHARPRVGAQRKGVTIELDVETVAGIDVPGQAEHIVETTRQIVEEKMGLKMARPPKINLRAIPYPKTAMTKVTATGVPIPPVPSEPERTEGLSPSGAQSPCAPERPSDSAI